jgi:hypothetical protein
MDGEWRDRDVFHFFQNLACEAAANLQTIFWHVAVTAPFPSCQAQKISVAARPLPRD